jgi:hypothetical protein
MKLTNAQEQCIIMLVAALREIKTRLDSAAEEVDCFNVYESRDLAAAALAKWEQL